MARRASSAAVRNSTGEAYISEERGRNRYLLRLPKDLDPRRRRFLGPLTPEGLAGLARKRDAMIAELDSQRQRAIAIGATTHPTTVREMVDLYIASATVKLPKERRRLLELYILPTCGRMLMATLSHREVNEALGKLADKGLSEQTGKHVKRAVNQLVKFAYRRDKISSIDWLLKLELPRGLKRDKRPRVVLWDDEYEKFMLHPEIDLELKALSAGGRCVGGARTGDLHAWRWEHIDLPGFADAYVPRPKTDGDDGPETLRIEIPPEARHFLKQWWLACGRPESGFVFGTTRPRRIGQGEKGQQRGRGVGYAARLRRALWAAGVRRFELHNDTPKTRKVDFHSFRRAYNTATANAGTNAQDAMQLAGHKNMETHLRYLQTRTVAAPKAAIPRIRLPKTDGARGRRSK